MPQPTREQFVNWFNGLPPEERIAAWYDCEAMTRADVEGQLLAASAATARASELEIQVRESRALLHRMAKYVREDRPTTAGSTRLERLTVQVTDYLQRTHDPRSILREAKDDHER